MTEDVRELLRRHNRMLHGCGVVSRCLVRAAEADWTVRIEPGYALGPHGDEIVVDGGQVDLSAHGSRRGDTVYVAVAYPDETEGSHVCESCRIAVLRQLPANHVEPDGAAPYVVLAAVNLRAPRVLDEDIDNDYRRHVPGHPR
jgi:hypothetical protein